MKTNRDAFTRIDLLAVIGTLSLLALTFAGDSRSNAEAAVCQNNMRQLVRAQFLYASDHLYFPPNISSGFESSPSRAWIAGLAIAGPSDTPGSPVINYIANSLLYDYADRNWRSFKCVSEQRIDRPYNIPRTRTVAMNHAVGTDPNDTDGPCKRPVPGMFLTGNSGHTANQVYRCFARPSDIVNPSPANLFIFLDEHPDSINDGMFASQGPGPVTSNWIDVPAAYHDGSGSFGMADGHAELHRWNRPFQQIVAFPPPGSTAALPDIQWLATKTSARRADQP